MKQQTEVLSKKGVERRIRQHIYAKEHVFFAVCQPGFESTVMSELKSFGVESEMDKTEGGVEFTAGIELIWKIHLSSHCITRIIMRIASFKAFFFNDIEKECGSIPWELHLLKGANLDISVSCSRSKLWHTGRIEDEVRKSIQKKQKAGLLIGGSDNTGSQGILVRLADDRCTISLDCTGEPLYKRGFRPFVERAPLRETLAGIILREAQSERFDALYDPMCGSGVFSIEGVLMAKGILPGSRRTFSFENWPGHSHAGFANFKKRLSSETAHNAKCRIYASDINEKAVETAKKNTESADLSGDVKIWQADLFTVKRSDIPEKKILITANPPYGIRLGADNGIIEFYRKLGAWLRTEFADAAYAVIVPTKEAEKALDMNPHTKHIFKNGGRSVTLCIGGLRT